jgi:acyl carrier protein
MSSASTSVRPQAVADIFRRVLEDEAVSETTDFFEAGGDSLLATRVLSAIARDFDAELTFDEFVVAANPTALARLIGSCGPCGR